MDIKYIKDNEGNNFFPVVHEKGVVDNNGTTLESKLQQKQDEITTVTVNVDDNTGIPSGSASMSGNTLSFNFSNIKGVQGIQGIQGPQGERGPQGNTGVQVDSVASIIHSIDPTATYAAADVAGADAVQDVLAEVTELAGKLDENVVTIKGIIDDGTLYDNTNYATGTRVGVFYPIDGFSAGQKIDITLKNIVYAGTNVRVWLCTEISRWQEVLVRVVALFSSGEEHSLTVELTETDLLTARYIQILSDANGAAVSFNSFVSLQGDNLKTLSKDVKELKENVRPIDTDAVEGSTNLVESGAVYDLTHITSSESVGGTRIAGKEVNYNTKTFWDNASCENYGFAVVPGDVFLVSSQVIGQGRTAMFYSQEGADPNDYISYFGEYQESMHTNNNVRIEIPEGCHYVYFNNRTDNGFVFSAKKQFVETIANKVQGLSDSYPKYSYDGTTLVLKGIDAEISFKGKGVNGIFMISKIATNNKTYIPSTDFVSPFIVRADANGVPGASRIHTGGYHGTDGGAGGNATAYTDSITILADGNQVTNTQGKFVSCTQIVFEVVNKVSAYNTIDNGVCLRYPIEEHDVYSFDGKRLNVNIQIIANENLHIEYYHGLQSAGYTTRGTLIGFDNVISTSFAFSSDTYMDFMPNLVEVQNEFGDCLLMHIDRVGIANSDKVTQDKMWGAYSYGKTGWNLIFDYVGLAMQANDRTTCVGYYEFNSIKKL